MEYEENNEDNNYINDDKEEKEKNMNLENERIRIFI
jgi:hypothetical protein